MSASSLLISQQIDLIEQQNSVACSPSINIPFFCSDFNNPADHNVATDVPSAAVSSMEWANKQQLVDTLDYASDTRDQFPVSYICPMSMQELADILSDSVTGNDHLIFNSGHSEHV
jgi:hypothetical protein